jgi:lipid-binding SYLF domain-containing protein
MNHFKRRNGMFANKIVLSSITMVWLAIFANTSVAEKKSHEEHGKEAERALSASNVINELMNTPESKIPKELVEHAHAIAVVPNIVKGAFGVGGSFGKGIISQRLNDRTWGTPSFIDLSSGSFGFQIGVSVTDLVLIFTREDGLKGLFNDKLELGGEAGATAGPIGREAEVGTNLTFDSPIYSYSRSKGLFAGIALKGAVMTIDDSANHKVYGEGVTGREILLEGKVHPTPAVMPFLTALKKAKAEAIARNEKEKAPATTIAKTTSTETAPPAQKSDISQAQEILHDKGYYKGSIDGIMGPMTRKAIREYQKAEKLPVNGQLDAQTANKLGIAPITVGANR